MTEATPEQVVEFMTNTMRSTPEQIITMLRAEIERLRALVKDVSATRDTAVNMKLERDAEIERLKVENDKMACQLEKIADFTVHPYSAAKAVLKELGRWQEPKP